MQFLGHGVKQQHDATSLVLGIGLCNGRQVVEHCKWDVARSAEGTALTFTTTHDYGGQQVEIEREVALLQRTLTSKTRLTNTGSAPVALAWYPHPFFPQPEGTDELPKFSVPITIPADSEGYTIARSGWLCRKRWPWARRENYYQAAAHGCDKPFTVLHKHPKCGLISGKIDYVPSLLPIWGNDRTISWEPHLERTVHGGQAASWSVEYEFGWLPSSM